MNWVSAVLIKQAPLLGQRCWPTAEKPVKRFELLTRSLRMSCSTPELHRHTISFRRMRIVFIAAFPHRVKGTVLATKWREDSAQGFIPGNPPLRDPS
jgi:hypothetical protein